MKKFSAVFLFLMLTVPVVINAAGPDISFYGYQWLRYDYEVVGSSYNAVPGKSENTFSIPRTYLGWKVSDPGAGYNANLILDFNNQYYITDAGKFDWGVCVKMAYVNLTDIPVMKDAGMQLRVGQQNVYFGMIDAWQYPLIEKSMEDKNGVVNSAGQGIAIIGKLPQSYGSYEAGVYNKSSYKTTDFDGTNNITGKLYDASLLISPFSWLYARASYLKNFGSQEPEYYALGGVVGSKTGNLECFLEYVTSMDAAKRIYSAVPGAERSGIFTGVSGYIGYAINNMLSVHLRADSYDPDTKAKNDEKNLYMAGVNVALNEKITVQFDYELVQEKFSGSGIPNDNQWMSQFVWRW